MRHVALAAAHIVAAAKRIQVWPYCDFDFPLTKSNFWAETAVAAELSSFTRAGGDYPPRSKSNRTVTVQKGTT